MNELINVDSDFEMSSLDFLNNVINPARVAAGEQPHEPRKFLLKIEDEIGDSLTGKKFRLNNNQTKTFYYDLSMDQMLLVGMRESKAVRRSVLAKLKELSQAAAPQQQQQLAGTPGTPEHFLDFITQGVTQALTQAYREYFGEPVKTALTDQQQHTEPVQALPAAPVQAKVEYRKPPQDKRSWAKLQKYIARKDIVMKCFEICGVHSEQFDPGYILDEDGRLIHCDEHTVYDRKQALAVILAIYDLSVPVSKTQREIDGKKFKDKLGNRCFTDIPQDAVDSAKQMIQAYIMKHGKLI